MPLNEMIYRCVRESLEAAAPRSFSKLNENYGECETNTVYLKPGWSYEVRLFHSGTKPGESVDYDYTLQVVDGLSANVFLVEGCAAGTELAVEGWVSAGDAEVVIARHDANIRISGVEDMYRWKCQRNVCGDLSGMPSRLASPTNWPDTESDGRHFVFVHGFNVNTDEARASAAEVFKRLWQSGSDSMFTAVEWYGNQEQTDLLEDISGTFSLNYGCSAKSGMRV